MSTEEKQIISICLTMGHNEFGEMAEGEQFLQYAENVAAAVVALEVEARIGELEHGKLAIWHPDAIRYIDKRIAHLKAQLSSSKKEKQS